MKSTTIRTIQRTVSLVALVLAATVSACGRNNSRAADTTLSSDLSLAAQQRGYDSLAAAERSQAALTAAPVNTVPVHHTSGGVEHRSASSAGTSASASSGGETVVKHTQRDAAIGAAAGAIIGATTSGSKVKGGIIGAVAGGVLGGVIGNNVDKTKKKP